LSGEELVLKRLRLKGGEGYIEASGTAGLVERNADIAVSARTLLVSRLPNRELIASGDGRLLVRDQRLRVQGKARVDRGRIELPKRDAPTLSSDIVIVGEEEEERAAQARGRQLMPQLEVEVDLGDRFFLKGEGLDARLTGAVALQLAEQRVPRAMGTIRTAEGTYAAYGQRLSLERGVLTFNGPLTNPALDILALRKNQEVQAGVAVTGTALQPVVKLVSIPPVPDADKLSWLVLGHGIEDSSSAETDVLAQAATALLARGESVTLQARIAQRTGLDEFRFSGGGGLEGAIVTLGKRLSSRVYVTYETGFTGTTDLFTARYTLSPRWSLQTQSGKATAVDLFYTFSFD
jgi:translocation and assembly module TamB